MRQLETVCYIREFIKGSSGVNGERLPELQPSVWKPIPSKVIINL